MRSRVSARSVTRITSSASGLKGRREAFSQGALPSSRTVPPASRAALKGFASAGLARVQPTGGSSRAMPKLRSPAVVMAGSIAQGIG